MVILDCNSFYKDYNVFCGMGGLLDIETFYEDFDLIDLSLDFDKGSVRLERDWRHFTDECLGLDYFEGISKNARLSYGYLGALRSLRFSYRRGTA